MSIIHTIRKKVVNQDYEFTIPHFFEEMADDNLLFSDIEKAIENGKVARKFTRDPRGTRYEIVGTTKNGRKIAIVCRVKNTGKLLFITTFSLEETE